MAWSGNVYTLELMPEARDDLARLDKPVAQRILSKLQWLAKNFEAATPEPLAGEWKGLFKVRVGGYRALYSVNQAQQRLTVYLIGHRREIYKRR